MGGCTENRPSPAAAAAAAATDPPPPLAHCTALLPGQAALAADAINNTHRRQLVPLHASDLQVRRLQGQLQPSPLAAQQAQRVQVRHVGQRAQRRSPQPDRRQPAQRGQAACVEGGEGGATRGSDRHEAAGAGAAAGLVRRRPARYKCLPAAPSQLTCNAGLQGDGVAAVPADHVRLVGNVQAQGCPSSGVLERGGEARAAADLQHRQPGAIAQLQPHLQAGTTHNNERPGEQRRLSRHRRWRVAPTRAAQSVAGFLPPSPPLQASPPVHRRPLGQPYARPQGAAISQSGAGHLPSWQRRRVSTQGQKRAMQRRPNLTESKALPPPPLHLVKRVCLHGVQLGEARRHGHAVAAAGAARQHAAEPAAGAGGGASLQVQPA